MHAELGSFKVAEKVAQTPSKHRSPSYHQRLAYQKATRMENVTNICYWAEEVSSFLVCSQNDSTSNIAVTLEDSGETCAVISPYATEDIEENFCAKML